MNCNTKGVVLLIDEDPSTRFVSRRALENAGYTVEEALDDSHTIALFEQTTPDLIFLRSFAAGVDRAKICQMLRSKSSGKSVPIFIMTGIDDIENWLTNDPRATDLLDKPHQLFHTLTKQVWDVEAMSCSSPSDPFVASQALRREEERYRSIVESIRDVIFTVSVDDTFISLNQAFENVTGWQREEWLSRSFIHLIHPEDLPTAYDAFHAGMRGVVTSEVEFRLLSKFGRYVYVEATWVPQYQDAEVTSILGIARDITERKVAERTTAVLQRRLSAMWNIAKMVDADHQAVSDQVLMETLGMTESSYGFFGYFNSNDDTFCLSSCTTHGVLNETSRALHIAAGGLWAEAVRARKAVIVNDHHGENHLPIGIPDDHVKLYRKLVVPVLHHEQVVAVLGVANKESDYTEDDVELLTGFLNNVQIVLEKRRAEESLRKLSLAIEQCPVSIMITDSAGNIEFVNPKFTEMSGYEPREVIGSNPRLFKSDLMEPAGHERLWQTVTAGRTWHGELINRKKNGELIRELATISSIKDNGGCITHFIAIKEDVTERRRLEKELHQAQKMEALGTLAGGIAHDFNNILTAMVGYCNLLKTGTAEGSREKGFVEQLLASVNRATGLTQSLLAYSRKQETTLIPMDLNQVLRRNNDFLQQLASEKIKLSMMLCTTELIVLADANQIVQIIMNLVANARDAISGEGCIFVHTEVAEIDSTFISRHSYGNIGRHAVIIVSDTGTGINDEIKERIFDPFFTTKDVGKGTGLGLSIVYGIVKQHHGFIGMEIGERDGTTFKVYLPRPCK